MNKYNPIKADVQVNDLTVFTQGEDYIFREMRFPRWVCRCKCGKECLIREDKLRRKGIKSCGCGRMETLKSRPKRITYKIENGSAVCTLTNGVSFLIDIEDLPEVSKRGWSYNRPRDYIFSHTKPQIVLSRFLLNCPPELDVDHKNHNRLDNRRCNLRLATKSQNGANKRPMSNGTSVYKGVSFCKQTRKWRATIGWEYKQITIGRYATEAEAAKAYNAVALELQGEFACLNEV